METQFDVKMEKLPPIDPFFQAKEGSLWSKIEQHVRKECPELKQMIARSEFGKFRLVWNNYSYDFKKMPTGGVKMTACGPLEHDPAFPPYRAPDKKK